MGLGEACDESSGADAKKDCPNPVGSYGSPPGVSISSLYLPSYGGEAAASVVQNDIREARHFGEAGVCGLRNLGNTCFMSAGVQCLVATPPLATALLDLQCDMVPPGQHGLTRDLADLMRQIWSGQYSSVHPSKFKDSLSKHYPQFNDYRQHDCQEFLALLLDGLHEQMNTVTKKDLTSHSYFKGKICDNIKAVNMNTKEYLSQRAGRASWDDLCYRPGTSGAASGDGSPADCSPLVTSLSDPVEAEDSYTSKSVKVDLSPVVQSRSPSPPEYFPGPSTSRPESPTCLNNTSTDVAASAPPSPKVLNNVRASSRQIVRSSIRDKDDYSSPGYYLGDSSDQYLNNSPGTSSDNSQPNTSRMVGGCCMSTPNHLINNTGVLENNDLPFFNSVCPNFASFEDILKNAKTSNVNVRGADSISQAANNSIRFDSEKFPRVDNIRTKEGFSYNALGSGKRTPGTNRVGLDMKRVKLEDEEEKNNRSDPGSPKMYLEKNIRMECERKEKNTEGENHWLHHLASNRSVIVTTFQGQFKSQVVCSVCQYVSITYEPFMYLSVPLPNAMKKEYRITFIDKHAVSTDVLVEMNKNKPVSELRDKLLEMLPTQPEGHIIMAEVLNHHVAKILDEHISVRCINDINRNIYAFELISIEDYADPSEDMDIQDSEQNMASSYDTLSCNICLEERDINLKKHRNCNFLICDNCILTSCQHYGDSWKCPTCSDSITPTFDLKPVHPNTNLQLRLVNVCVVFRVESELEDSVYLIGHPLIIRVANVCHSDYLISAITKVSPYKQPFTLRLVDGQGLWCSKCMYSEHCRGCAGSGRMKLSPSSTLAVCLSSRPPDPTPSLPLAEAGHSSKSRFLNIYDCINAFSQSEVLDSNNPWFCPNCKKNQCATKTLSVWRYPDYLIVYLKRFVFHDHISTKIDERVEFPLEGLELSGFMYDLYACVCHVGGVSAGHYTTYSLHSQTGVWHYFNDCLVQVKAPRELEFSTAYILFYKKRFV